MFHRVLRAVFAVMTPGRFLPPNQKQDPIETPVSGKHLRQAVGAIFSIWRRERRLYEVAKLKFEKSIPKSISSPIFKTPGKHSR
uniref:SFRICE_017212 n=1 Tax=Spodoptera frugiperda TaxID=7108 RepID=A0A2H1WQ77_SPOFR